MGKKLKNRSLKKKQTANIWLVGLSIFAVMVVGGYYVVASFADSEIKPVYKNESSGIVGSFESTVNRLSGSGKAVERCMAYGLNTPDYNSCATEEVKKANDEFVTRVIVGGLFFIIISALFILVRVVTFSSTFKEA